VVVALSSSLQRKPCASVGMNLDRSLLIYDADVISGLLDIICLKNKVLRLSQMDSRRPYAAILLTLLRRPLFSSLNGTVGITFISGKILLPP